MSRNSAAMCPLPKKYKYTVRVGDKTLDPDGGVKP